MVTTQKEDYYEILGVSKSASKAEIRKAFRKLSKKCHPDRNQNDKAAEQKFKDIQEAYDVLSDDQKRKRYDQFGRVFPNGQAPDFGRGGPGSRTYSWASDGDGGDVEIDPGDLFGGGGFGGFGFNRGGSTGTTGVTMFPSVAGPNRKH